MNQIFTSIYANRTSSKPLRKRSLHDSCGFADWDSMEVAHWLMCNSQVRLCRLFFQQKIDGKVLLQLSKLNLLKESNQREEWDITETEARALSFLLVQLCRGHWQIMKNPFPSNTPKVHRERFITQESTVWEFRDELLMAKAMPSLDEFNASYLLEQRPERGMTNDSCVYNFGNIFSPDPNPTPPVIPGLLPSLPSGVRRIPDEDDALIMEGGMSHDSIVYNFGSTLFDSGSNPNTPRRIERDRGITQESVVYYDFGTMFDDKENEPISPNQRAQEILRLRETLPKRSPSVSIAELYQAESPAMTPIQEFKDRLSVPRLSEKRDPDGRRRSSSVYPDSWLLVRDVIFKVLQFMEPQDQLRFAMAHPSETVMQAAQYEGMLLGVEVGAAVAFLKGGGTLESHLFWEGDDAIYADNRGGLSTTQIYCNGSDFSSIQSTGSMRYSLPALSCSRSFVGLKEDGTLISWGRRRFGAEILHLKDDLVNIKQIFHTRSAWAALKKDGSVVTWGNSKAGGDSSGVWDLLRSGVESICSTENAFAAIKADGSIVTWGSAKDGGDSKIIQYRFDEKVIGLYSTDHAFAALKENGCVVTWGDKKFGGRVPDDKYLYDVLKIVSNRGAFAALRADGTVLTWGREDVGGDFRLTKSDDMSDSPRVVDLKATIRDFEAIMEDGSSVVIDYHNRGGAQEY